MDNIEEVYKNLLNSTELSKEDVAKMTDDDINNLLKKSEEVINNNPQLKVIADLPSNNGVLFNENPIDGEDVVVDVMVNPVTGEKYIMKDKVKTSTEEEKEFISETFEEMLNNPAYNPDNMEDIILPENIIKSNLKNKFNFLNEIDMLKFVELITTYQAGNKKDVFGRLPESIQKEITKSYFENGAGGDIRLFKKAFAENIVETFILESSIDKIQVDFQDEMKKAFSEISEEVKDYYSKELINKINNLRKVSEKIKDEDPDKSETLLSIADSMEESFKLVKFKEELSTKYYKIKPFELEKPDKVFRDFNNKYINSVLNINNITMTPSIIRNHLSEDEISDDQIIKFLLVFCKYTKNMHPSNVIEHSFMYYFIANIISLSVFEHEENEFFEDFIANIKECILLIK